MSEKETLQVILETVTFLKDNAVTKKEFNQRAAYVDKRIESAEKDRKSIREDMQSMKSEIIEHIDALASQQDQFFNELAALRYTTDRHEVHINQIAKHINLELKEGVS